jgi:hypothetical protein
MPQTVNCTCWETVGLSSFTDLLKEHTNSARKSSASTHVQHENEYEQLIMFHDFILTAYLHPTLAVFTTACHFPIVWVKWIQFTPFQTISFKIHFNNIILFSAFWWQCAMVWCRGTFIDGETLDGYYKLIQEKQILFVVFIPTILS